MATHWCTAYIKIHVGATALCNQDRFNYARTLLMSRERAEENPERADYAMFEHNTTDARDCPKLARHIDRDQTVHRWKEAGVS